VPPAAKPAPKSRSKKARPSFDIAREPVVAAESGWVYRSDPSAAPVLTDSGPGEPAPGEPLPRIFRPNAASPAVLDMVPPRGGVQRRAAPIVQDDAEPAAASSWFATGIYFMTLPITISVQIMFAPVSWMLSARSRR
jgi:hypothetical protein